MISPIEQIGALGGVQQNGAVEKAAGAEDGMFESVFRSAIENVKETDKEVVELEYMMATGQLDKLTQTREDKGYEKVAYPRTISLRGKK